MWLYHRGAALLTTVYRSPTTCITLESLTIALLVTALWAPAIYGVRCRAWASVAAEGRKARVNDAASASSAYRMHALAGPPRVCGAAGQVAGPMAANGSQCRLLAGPGGTWAQVALASAALGALVVKRCALHSDCATLCLNT